MKLRLLSVILACSFSVAAQTTPTPVTKVTVTWADTTAAATFNIWRWTTGQNGFQKINTTPTTATVVPCVPVISGKTCYTYNDTIALGVLYAYKISAVSGGTESAESVEADITVSPTVIVPAVPTDVKVNVVITSGSSTN
jgi:hypothetical protein